VEGPHLLKFGLSRVLIRSVSESFQLTRKKRVIWRMKVALLHNRIEKTLSMEELLYLYLNQIYFGHRAYGVEAAARSYFGKSVQHLTIAECAMLAGLVQSPVRCSPRRDMNAALDRRNYVLRRMYEHGKITREECEKARREELVCVEASKPDRKKFEEVTEPIRRYVAERYGEDTLLRRGLKVFTTIDSTHIDATDQGKGNIGDAAPNAYIKRIVDKRGRILEEH